eukprot:3774223-Prorocentrum_lima.AAC.1
MGRRRRVGSKVGERCRGSKPTRDRLGVRNKPGEFRTDNTGDTNREDGNWRMCRLGGPAENQ